MTPDEIEQSLKEAKTLDMSVADALNNPHSMIHQALLNAGASLKKVQREWGRIYKDPRRPEEGAVMKMKETE